LNTVASAPSRLRALLASRRFAITAEITPPLSTDPEPLRALARPLRGLADAVNVTDAPGARARMSAMAAAAILARDGIETVMQLTCRDRNRLALQGDVLGALALGVRNFMVLRGDDPARGDQPETKPVFDLDTPQLLATLAEIRDTGRLPGGRAVEGPRELVIGAGDIPLDPPPKWKPRSLIAKAGAGAEFIQTQFCMDTGVVARYIARLAEHGLTERLAILIGIAPLVSAASARWMQRHLPGTIIPDATVERIERAGDPRAEGKRICIELLGELSDIPGVGGVHIMAPMHEEAIPEVIAESGILDRRR
jgi:methylenetetrahydrofolate reductase (NADH)